MNTEDEQDTPENSHTICCVCGQIKIGGQWVDFTDELKEANKNKIASHGVCDICIEQLR